MVGLRTKEDERCSGRPAGRPGGRRPAPPPRINAAWPVLTAGKMETRGGGQLRRQARRCLGAPSDVTANVIHEDARRGGR